MDEENIFNGEQYYLLPTAHEIGEQDAQVAINNLANAYPEKDDTGIWSGNLLSIGLGDASFW